MYLTRQLLSSVCLLNNSNNELKLKNSEHELLSCLSKAGASEIRTAGRIRFVKVVCPAQPTSFDNYKTNVECSVSQSEPHGFPKEEFCHLKRGIIVRGGISVITKKRKFIDWHYRSNKKRSDLFLEITTFSGYTAQVLISTTVT